MLSVGSVFNLSAKVLDTFGKPVEYALVLFSLADGLYRPSAQQIGNPVVAELIDTPLIQCANALGHVAACQGLVQQALNIPQSFASPSDSNYMYDVYTPSLIGTAFTGSDGIANISATWLSGGSSYVRFSAYSYTPNVFKFTVPKPHWKMCYTPLTAPVEVMSAVSSVKVMSQPNGCQFAASNEEKLVLSSPPAAFLDVDPDFKGDITKVPVCSMQLRSSNCCSQCVDSGRIIHRCG